MKCRFDTLKILEVVTLSNRFVFTDYMAKNHILKIINRPILGFVSKVTYSRKKIISRLGTQNELFKKKNVKKQNIMEDSC